MLGFYDNFPQNIHDAEKFSSSVAHKKLQRALVETLYRLNSKKLPLEKVTAPSVPGCRVIFEIGVAEGNDFNYLDAQERERLSRALNKKPFPVMDFLCAIRYERMQEEKKKRMRIDYYMLRLIFSEGLTEVQVFHEKGIRYTSPDDLVKLVVKKVNAAFSKKVLRPSEAA